jgi:hypothetical protein
VSAWARFEPQRGATAVLGLMFAADVPLAALAPIVLIGVAFLAYCLVDVVRAPSVRFLPRWAWAIICIASVPIGGIAYLLIGRGDRG